MLFVFLSLFLWEYSYRFLVKSEIMIHRKLNKNLVCFVHSIICSLITYYNINRDLPNYTLLYYFSFGYFIWDIVNIVIHKDFNDLMFIYHHIICLLALSSLIKGESSEIINKVFFLGEASNFFNYITYHCIKSNYFKNNIIILKIIQFVWFFYFRIILISETIYRDFHKLHNVYFGYTLLTIHALSFLWISKQFKIIAKYLLN